MYATRKAGPATKQVAANLRVWRAENERSQAWLARKMAKLGHASWHTQTVSAVEGGQRTISVDELVSLAGITGVKPEALLFFSLSESLMQTVSPDGAAPLL
jgi:hypothetical protein